MLPTCDRPYDPVKATLIQRTTETEQHQLQQLLTLEELGDRKLTDLLRQMQALGWSPGSFNQQRTSMGTFPAAPSTTGAHDPDRIFILDTGISSSVEQQDYG